MSERSWGALCTENNPWARRGRAQLLLAQNLSSSRAPLLIGLTGEQRGAFGGALQSGRDTQLPA